MYASCLPACLWVRHYVYLSCVPASPLMTHASFFLTLYQPPPSLSSLMNTHPSPVISFYIELLEGSGTEQKIVERWQRQGKCGFPGVRGGRLRRGSRTKQRDLITHARHVEDVRIWRDLSSPGLQFCIPRSSRNSISAALMASATQAGAIYCMSGYHEVEVSGTRAASI